MRFLQLAHARSSTFLDGFEDERVAMSATDMAPFQISPGKGLGSISMSFPANLRISI